MGWQWEGVRTGITLGVCEVVTRLVVEGLGNVSDIVDQQTKGVRLCECCLSRVQPVLDVVVDVGVEVVGTIFAREPVREVLNSLSKVMSIR